MADNCAHHDNPCQATTIDVLPNDVLLTIFDFCGVRDRYFPRSGNRFGTVFKTEVTRKRILEWWQPLVHVCRRWRGLVLGSPRRLNLQLYCTLGTVGRKSLDVWPSLPLLIMDDDGFDPPVDNRDLTSVLEHSRNRIRQISLVPRTLTTPQIEKVLGAMQVPFPELTVLTLDLQHSPSEAVTVLPDTFLGGSAPHLRFLTLNGIPFPRLQKLLLSATYLVELHLYRVPHSAYISPEKMVTCLSTLTSLERLSLGFESPQSCPDQESRRYAPPPPARIVLPTLMAFWFKGVHEYSEDLLARIDAPLLYQFSATFFNAIDLDTPELIKFITGSRSLTLKTLNEADMTFGSHAARVKFQPQASDVEYFEVTISCRVLGWQLSALAQICTSSLPLLSMTETLHLFESHSQVDWGDDIENTEWLQLLLPFTAMNKLCLSEQFVPRVSLALKELTGNRMVETLPALRELFLEGFQPSEPVQKGITQFISTRQLIKRPIAVSSWGTGSNSEQDRSLEVAG